MIVKKKHTYHQVWIPMLIGIFVFLLCPVKTQASTGGHSADDAINWVRSQVGKGLDYDGAYGNQCVDLICYYYKYLGQTSPGGNAIDYTSNKLPSGWSRIQGAQPQKGDILVYSGGEFGHVAIYANDYESYHQNFNKHKYIEKITYKYNQMGIQYWGIIRPDFETDVYAPENPTIQKSQIWYDLKDTIKIYMHADYARGYYISVFKDGQKIIGQSVDSGEFTMLANQYGEGEYSAYCSCVNSKGAVDSSWINFNVVGKAGYSKVSKSAEWYDLKDTISISVDTVCAKGQVIGIDKVGGGRVITSECDSTYQIAASNLGIGEYSAYFSVYNGSGGVDTERVDFKIVGEPKYSEVKTEKKVYDLSDTVSILVDTICAKGQVIGIDKVGVGRVITSKCDSTYQIAASNLGIGEYSAYFSVYNGSGSIDTKRVEFSIVNKNGVYKAEDNNWYYYKNGKKDTSFTGLAKNTYGVWYCKNGKVQFATTGVIQSKGTYDGWYYVKKGQLQTGEETVEQNSNGWWYISKDGKVDFNFTGLAKNTYGVWYCKKGKVQFNTTDVLYSKGTLYNGWYYVKKGQLQTGKTTVEKNGSGWWYIGKDGKVDFSFTGIASNAYGSWYLEKGKVSFSKNIKSYTDPHTKLKYRVVRGKATRI